MPIVSGNRLHRYMSEPRWTTTQHGVAEDLCAEVERDLEAALYGAVISPQEIVEDAPISRQGIVETRLPVFALIAVGGAVAADGVAPAGYRLDQHVLRTIAVPGAITVPLGGGPQRGEPIYVGSVAVHYMGGWGDDAALVEAILRKAAVRMGNRHSDTMVVTGVTAQSAPSRPPEHWTEDDLRSLNRYRRLSGGG